MDQTGETHSGHSGRKNEHDTSLYARIDPTLLALDSSVRDTESTCSVDTTEAAKGNDVSRKPAHQAGKGSLGVRKDQQSLREYRLALGLTPLRAYPTYIEP